MFTELEIIRLANDVITVSGGTAEEPCECYIDGAIGDQDNADGC